MDIPKLRLLNQQLANPLFHSPKELVSWMGAVQAQDYAMAKWAVGMRLASATVRTVEEALQKGEIFKNARNAPYMASGGGRRYSLDAEALCPAYKSCQ